MSDLYEIHYVTRCITPEEGELVLESHEELTVNDRWPWVSTAAKPYKPGIGDTAVLCAILGHFAVGANGIMSIALDDPYTLRIRFNRHLVRESKELKKILGNLFGYVTAKRHLEIDIQLWPEFNKWGGA
jgi:hypothetical protein